MIQRFNVLKPVVGLFLERGRGMMLCGLAVASITALAGIALLGVSGWFITATAIAGLAPATAYVFDVFAPSATIRLLALSRTAARYGERLTTHDAALSVLAALRERLFRGWATASASREMAARPARLLNRLTADIDALDSLYLRVLVPGLVALIAAVACGVALAFLHPLFGLFAFLFLICIGLGIAVMAGMRAEKIARRRAIGLDALRTRVVDLISGQSELLIAGKLTGAKESVAEADAYLYRADNRLNRIEVNTGLAFGVASACLVSAALVVVAWLAETRGLGAPEAVFGLLVCLAALEPFAALRRGALELGRTLFAARRIAGRLEPQDKELKRLPPEDGLALQLRSVAFSHRDAANMAIEDIDLAVRAGERVALVGASGAGKTTLLRLLSGELAPTFGNVMALPSVLLTQRNQLFRESLRDNLRLANATACDEQLMTALHAAGLAQDIESMPDGLDTRLGEGGLGLSGGQSRRLALARILLRDAPLWLMDEPTEGLDGQTARDVLNRISLAAKNRSLVIATHIRREAELADRILLLREGRQVRQYQKGTREHRLLLQTLRPD